MEKLGSVREDGCGWVPCPGGCPAPCLAGAAPLRDPGKARLSNQNRVCLATAPGSRTLLVEKTRVSQDLEQFRLGSKASIFLLPPRGLPRPSFIRERVGVGAEGRRGWWEGPRQAWPFLAGTGKAGPPAATASPIRSLPLSSTKP